MSANHHDHINTNTHVTPPEPAAPAPAAPAPSAPRSLREAWVALAGLSAVFLFEMLENSILNVALPTIGRDPHASTVALQWVTGAYAVVFGALMLLFGALADRYGRRRMMLIGLLWAITAAAGVGVMLFIRHERVATASMGYLVTLQLQLAWGWPPALAAIGMLPQVIVLIAGGAFVTPFVERVGLTRAAWLSAVAVVCGLAVYGLLSHLGYGWIALALVAGTSLADAFGGQA